MIQLHGLIFDHIGYVTQSITDTASFYQSLGYRMSEVVVDEIQCVNICFLRKDGFPTIELVEPVDENSSVCKLLKKNGVSPYHICYGVDSVDEAYSTFVKEYDFIPLFRPVEAFAMGNRLICYLYRKDIGFIELVNNN